MKVEQEMTRCHQVVIITHNVVSCCIGVVVKLVFPYDIIELRINSPHDGIELVIELGRSVCRDMLMMIDDVAWHD